jgi:hypothetical protein
MMPRRRAVDLLFRLVGVVGLEPTTSAVCRERDPQAYLYSTPLRTTSVQFRSILNDFSRDAPVLVGAYCRFS